MKTIELFVKKIHEAGDSFNPGTQTAPSCILWPDGEKQWEGAIDSLLKELPELFILGDYNLKKHRGPAIWLRCVLAGKIADMKTSNRIPIFYLPGVSRQDLRVVEKYPSFLKPLAELQFRGIFWSQLNTKDWTIPAFLKSEQIGLKLELAQDSESKVAMLRALIPLLDSEIDYLKEKKLDKDFFNNLLTRDYQRLLLKWFDEGESFKASLDKNNWQALADLCKSNLDFDPDKDGVITGLTKFATHESSWLPIWERFREAPKRYPKIPNALRKCKPPINITMWISQKENDGWPQWNESQEKNLWEQLKTLNNLTPNQAREKILELEKDHGARRENVWTELSESPLAQALEHLSNLAKITTKTLAVGNINDLVNRYQTIGWQADDAVLQSLSFVKEQKDLEAITLAINAIYKPWAEDSARYLQKIVSETEYPGGNYLTYNKPNYTEGECVLFIDGLRYDIAKRLGTILEQRGCQIEEKISWAPLPSVTATGKPAVTPIHDKIIGKNTSTDFEPCVAESGQPLKNYQLIKLLKDLEWEVIEGKSNFKKGNAWCECGDIDHEGHTQGWKIVKSIDRILNEITEKINILLRAGWKKIRIVTDHGWLLLPGNLPKIELPTAQIETKWGRCAGLKPGASTNERLYPWYWNPTQHFALADGISCFVNGKEYEHGGLSLQECLTLELHISLPPHSSLLSPEIIEVVWKGFRCVVSIDGVFEPHIIDIRSQPGDSSSSLVITMKEIHHNGTFSLMIDNEELEATSAIIVLINKQGELVAQANTIIGGAQHDRT